MTDMEIELVTALRKAEMPEKEVAFVARLAGNPQSKPMAIESAFLEALAWQHRRQLPTNLVTRLARKMHMGNNELKKGPSEANRAG